MGHLTSEQQTKLYDEYLPKFYFSEEYEKILFDFIHCFPGSVDSKVLVRIEKVDRGRTEVNLFELPGAAEDAIRMILDYLLVVSEKYMLQNFNNIRSQLARRAIRGVLRHFTSRIDDETIILVMFKANGYISTTPRTNRRTVGGYDNDLCQ